MTPDNNDNKTLEDVRLRHGAPCTPEKIIGKIERRARKVLGINPGEGISDVATSAKVLADHALELRDRYRELAEATQTGYVVVNHFLDDDTLIHGGIYLSKERAHEYREQVINQLAEEYPNRSEEQLDRNITVAWKEINRGVDQ